MGGLRGLHYTCPARRGSTLDVTLRSDVDKTRTWGHHWTWWSALKSTWRGTRLSRWNRTKARSWQDAGRCCPVMDPFAFSGNMLSPKWRAFGAPSRQEGEGSWLTNDASLLDKALRLYQSNEWIVYKKWKGIETFTLSKVKYWNQWCTSVS